MSKKAWVLTVLCALMLFAVYHFWPAPALPVLNYPSAGTDIIAFGDSLITGQGASDGKDFVSLLSASIGRPIVNLGVSGNTSAQGLARLSQLDHYNPKVVLLLLGGNDAIERVPQQKTFDNLGKIIEDIQSRGGIALLLGVRGGTLGDPYASQFEALAKKYRTAFVPNVLQGLFGDANYIHDSTHPNDEGYAIIAKRVLPVLKGLLY